MKVTGVKPGDNKRGRPKKNERWQERRARKRLTTSTGYGKDGDTRNLKIRLVQTWEEQRITTLTGRPGPRGMHYGSRTAEKAEKGLEWHPHRVVMMMDLLGLARAPRALKPPVQTHTTVFPVG